MFVLFTLRSSEGAGIPTSGIPCAEKIDTAGEETSLQQTKQDTAGIQLLIVFDETHANHDSTPKGGDQGQVNARADLSDKDGGRRLENDVWDEEDEIRDVLVIVSGSAL